MRQARLQPGNKRMEPFADGSCESMHRRPPAVLPLPPFPFSRQTFPMDIPNAGRPPPLGGGRMLAHPPFSKHLPAIQRQSSPSTKSPEEQKFSNHWKTRLRPRGSTGIPHTSPPHRAAPETARFPHHLPFPYFALTSGSASCSAAIRDASDGWLDSNSGVFPPPLAAILRQNAGALSGSYPAIVISTSPM